MQITPDGGKFWDNSGVIFDSFFMTFNNIITIFGKKNYLRSMYFLSDLKKNLSSGRDLKDADEQTLRLEVEEIIYHPLYTDTR